MFSSRLFAINELAVKLSNRPVGLTLDVLVYCLYRRARHAGLICRFSVALDFSQALVTTHRCYEIGATSSLCQPSTGGLTQSVSRRSTRQPTFVAHIAKPIRETGRGEWRAVKTSKQRIQRHACISSAHASATARLPHTMRATGSRCAAQVAVAARGLVIDAHGSLGLAWVSKVARAHAAQAHALASNELR